MAGRTRIEMEDRWYDVFSGWDRADREAALKVITALHRRLPDDPKQKVPKPSDDPPPPGNPAKNGNATDKTGAQPAVTLLDGQTDAEAIR